MKHNRATESIIGRSRWHHITPTYVNALAKAGFVIEQLIEQTDDEIMQSRDDKGDLTKRAKMLPVTFVIKARKL